MKYWIITADYRPKNPHKPTYKIKTKDNVTKKDIKRWWKSVYSWLKVYDIQEIDEKEYLKGKNRIK